MSLKNLEIFLHNALSNKNILDSFILKQQPEKLLYLAKQLQKFYPYLCLLATTIL